MGRYETVCHTGTSTGWDWNCYFLAGTGIIIIIIIIIMNISPRKLIQEPQMRSCSSHFIKQECLKHFSK